jgi:hypothetical protein
MQHTNDDRLSVFYKYITYLYKIWGFQVGDYEE